ncbi:MAG TPA: ADP-ribosylglycohydrolase family protein [Planctomycetota bacterium]|nr:ADP-ribosylglycohydrolase family protein [Planctomycetota bacterium]
MERRDRLVGLLLGQALGDALGLPLEGLSRERVARRRAGGRVPGMLFGRLLVSDDTEHALLTAQALRRRPDFATPFVAALAWRLRWWFISLPPGVGMATARASLRLWLGVPPDASGVDSAGNGPCMRAPVIGLRFAYDENRRMTFVQASTRLTHTDERALVAARALAEAAAWIGRVDRDLASLAERLRTCSDARDVEWRARIDHLFAAYARAESVDSVATRLGLGDAVSGFAYDTAPMAIYAWLRHRQDPVAAIEAAIACGGDTDTVAALTGALVGADVGTRALPREWLGRLADWPLSEKVLRRVGEALARDEDVPRRAVWWWWPLMPVRNLLMLLIVLAHGVRRWLR